MAESTFLLNENLGFRGWDGRPFGVYNAVNHTVDFYNKSAYKVFLMCDGQTVFDPDKLPEGKKQFFYTLLKNGSIRENTAQEKLTKKQEYVKYPATYKREVHWSITGACNYRCRHCFMSSPTYHYTEPTDRQCLDAIRQFAECGIGNVSLTGGEPLVSPLFWNIAEELTEKDIRIQTIYTNGALVDKGLTDRLKTLGVKANFHVSFDGIGWHDWLRGTDGAEEKVLDAIRLLTQQGFQVSCSMTLHRHNIDSIIPSVKLLSSLGVSYLKTNLATPEGLWVTETEHFADADEVNRTLYERIIPEFFDIGAPVSVQFCEMLEYDRNKKACTIPAAKFGGTQDARQCWACGSIKNSMYLSPEGYVLPCMPFIGTVMQQRFPNIRNKPLKEILTESFYLDICRIRMGEVTQHNLKCRSCGYKDLCGGGCRALGCGSSGTDYLYADQNACDFFQHGWYEKAKELCDSSSARGS